MPDVDAFPTRLQLTAAALAARTHYVLLGQAVQDDAGWDRPRCREDVGHGA